MADVPQVLPVVLPARRPEPGWLGGGREPVGLGGEPVVLPAHMPSGLPDGAARRLAAVLADQRQRGRSGTPVSAPSGEKASGVASSVVVCSWEEDLVLDQAEC